MGGCCAVRRPTRKSCPCLLKRLMSSLWLRPCEKIGTLDHVNGPEGITVRKRPIDGLDGWDRFHWSRMIKTFRMVENHAITTKSCKIYNLLVASGNLLHSYWTWPIEIGNLPVNMVYLSMAKRSPEGIDRVDFQHEMKCVCLCTEGDGFCLICEWWNML